MRQLTAMRMQRSERQISKLPMRQLTQKAIGYFESFDF